jgi:flavorubredoxin
MPYKEHVRNNLEKISMLDIKMIAPSHGPVYRNPDIIIDQYKEWVAPETKNLCVIAYTSMHGSTEFMAKYLETKLKERSVNALLFSLPDADIGELAIALVDARSVLVGSPTVLAAPHPYATFGAAVIGAVIPKAKYYGIFGSHLWSGRAVEIITSLLPRANTKILPPVLIKGLPEEKDLALLDALAEAIAEKHKDKSN